LSIHFPSTSDRPVSLTSPDSLRDAGRHRRWWVWGNSGIWDSTWDYRPDRDSGGYRLKTRNCPQAPPPLTGASRGV